MQILTSRQSFLGVLKLPLSSELTIKRKFSRDPALVGQNVHVHSGHYSCFICILSDFFKNNGNFLLNNGIDK